MRPRLYRWILRPGGTLRVSALLLGSLLVWSVPQARCEASVGSLPHAEHIGSLPAKDGTTGIEFSPLGIAFDIMDDLYVVDSDHSRIYEARDGAAPFTVFSECPDEFPECDFIDLAANPTGGVYVSERSSGSVLALDRWGELEAYVETGGDVAGIAAGRPGDVFTATGIDGSVRMVDFEARTEGLESRIAHGDEDAYPVDCCVLADGSIAVTDAFSKEVFLLSPLGELRGTARGFTFESPFGIARLGDGLILVADSGKGVVAVFDAHGDFEFAFGDGVLETPTFLDCTSDGTVCVSDAGKMTVEVFRIELADQE
jgi:hypothetical protein